MFNHLSLSGGAVQVFQEGFHYAITTYFGLHVTYDLVYHVTVTVPGNYCGKTSGLCGNFNGNHVDNLLMPNGKLTKDVPTFGKSWKVAIPGKVCDDGCAQNTCLKCDPARRAVFEKPHYCGVISSPNGTFATCHSKLDPEPYFNDCIFDMCASEGDGKVLCDSVTAYAWPGLTSRTGGRRNSVLCPVQPTATIASVPQAALPPVQASPPSPHVASTVLRAASVSKAT
uniref:VWFD domain-containing protein n=1 Tax=Hucho hucho TaxID=62062 RepID=A0A4W5K3S9_9TELE